MNTYNSQCLSNAVATICPDIESRVHNTSYTLNERRLWWELSTCILSSQVPYSLAVAAADAIDAERLLLNEHCEDKYLLPQIIKVLNEPFNVGGRPRRYRFPVARGRYLATTRHIITAKKCSLFELVNCFGDAAEARCWLVKHIPGLGPKQASMFLRNAGISYELAILDRHVLNYMSEIGIYSGAKRSVSNLSQYRQHEAALRKHAQQLDCSVGLLDWAIWIVMRVAKHSMKEITL